MGELQCASPVTGHSGCLVMDAPSTRHSLLRTSNRAGSTVPPSYPCKHLPTETRTLWEVRALSPASHTEYKWQSLSSLPLSPYTTHGKDLPSFPHLLLTDSEQRPRVLVLASTQECPSLPGVMCSFHIPSPGHPEPPGCGDVTHSAGVSYQVTSRLSDLPEWSKEDTLPDEEKLHKEDSCLKRLHWGHGRY